MLKKKKYKILKNYCDDYFNELNTCVNEQTQRNLKKITNFLLIKYKKKKKISLFVEMVVLLQLQIILNVTIKRYYQRQKKLIQELLVYVQTTH